MARQQRMGFVIWGITMVGFALPDYLQMGPSIAFWQLTAYRVAMGVLLALAFVRLGRRPALAPSGQMVMWLGLAGYPFFCLFYVLRPELRDLNTGMIMLLQLSVFMFFPGRALVYVPVAVAGVLAPLGTLWALGSGQPRLMGALFVLTLPAVVGYASAVQLQRAQRLEFQMRRQLQSANDELKAEVQRRTALEQELKHQASTDPLTGLANRRAFELAAKRELARARRAQSPLSLALLDIDHFKRINDEHGHAAGDEVLRVVGRVLAECLRCEDCVGRVGGEEFAVMLPGAALSEAREVLQRVLARLASTTVQAGPQRIAVTATVGLAQCSAGGASLEALLSSADAALYAGKREGRNRVMVAADVPAAGEPDGALGRYAPHTADACRAASASPRD